ncbi:hypothetical protein [uncultured Paludibaculum sp.]|uniref:hypothetical protein n=1 Tax=uncultured Paludibaculum sp. TaxID=1765020 RepID=UPI002AAB520A|nr:hypothetical protein [uncultured Paludibaculum sp.]
MPQAAQIFSFIMLLGYLCLLGFLVWRFYWMTRDVADIKQLLESLLGQQKEKGAAPSPEPRPIEPSED